MTLATTVAGFSVLPVSYTSSSSTHYIYARPHATSKQNAASSSLPDGRTLFLVNVPPDATERELVLLFKAAGTVEKVVFDLDPKDALVEPDDSDVSDEEEEEADSEENEGEDSQPRKRRKLDKQRPPKVVPLPTPAIRRLRPTGRTAHVVFLDASSLTRALAPSSQNKPRQWPSSEEPFGLARYAALHAALRPPLDAVRAHADSAMELFEYEALQTKRASKYRKGEAIVDEDGFTLVTRGGAYGQTLGGGVAVASKQFQETGETSARNQSKKKKGKGEKEKDGFYAFQKAEKQRNDLMELKKNWEADKAKVEKLKASRRFKPY